MIANVAFLSAITTFLAVAWLAGELSFLAPYKASVSFQKLLYAPGTRQERARQTFIAQIDFSLRDHVPNEFIRVNPLGLQVSYFRVDQAFEEGK